MSNTCRIPIDDNECRRNFCRKDVVGFKLNDCKLTLIYGRAGSGKTEYLYRDMEQRVRRGERCILLLPEQFTSAAELYTTKRFGDTACHYIQVESFARLARKSEQKHGGAVDGFVSEAARVAICRRAVLAVETKLVYFNGKHSPGFYTACAEIIKEFKKSVSPQELAKLAADDKMRDLSLIYSAYCALLDGRLEPEDRITRAASAIGEYRDFLRGIHIYLDNFDGFTRPEYELLSAILASSDSVTVTLCAPALQGGADFFDTVLATGRHLERLAEQNGIPVAPHVLLTENRRAKGGLEQLNLHLATNEAYGVFDRITLSPYDNRAQEIHEVAATIHRYITGGVRYSDIAVVMREPQQYRSELLRAFSLFDIPVYLDEPDELRHSAPAVLVLSLISLMSGLNTADIFTLLGTGLCDIDETQQAALTDWALRFDPSPSDWRGGIDITEQQKRYASGEPIRANIVARLSPLYREENSALNLYDTLLALGVTGRCEHCLQELNAVLALLEELHEFAKQPLSVQELHRLFLILLQNTEFHTIPQKRDSVVLSSPDRLVRDDVEILFAVGVNSGVFPSQVGASGLLTHADREALAAQDIMLPGLYENRVMLEDLYLYRTLCTPKTALHISYLKPQEELSGALHFLIEHDLPTVMLSRYDLTATVKAAAFTLSREVFDPSGETATLQAALGQFGCEEVVSDVLTAARQPCFDLSDSDTMKRLLPEPLYLSQSRVSTYSNCPFCYLLKYVLNIKPVRKLELSADVAGNLVHFILEKVLEQNGELTDIPDRQLITLTHRLTDEYIKAYFGDNLPVRLQYIIERLRESAARLLLFIKQEQSDSLFRPVATECDMPRYGEDSYRLITDDGTKVIVTGKVDRIDSCDIDGNRYLRVVDYKTGTKTFSLQDVFYGLDIQLLLYMFYAAGRYKAQPAAALFLSSEPKSNDYAFDGMLLNNEQSLTAMSLATIPAKQTAAGTIVATTKDKMFSLERAGIMKRHIDKLLCDVAAGMTHGRYDAVPLCGSNTPCEFCDYGSVCRHVQGVKEREKVKVADLFN